MITFNLQNGDEVAQVLNTRGIIRDLKRRRKKPKQTNQNKNKNKKETQKRGGQSLVDLWKYGAIECSRVCKKFCSIHPS